MLNSYYSLSMAQEASVYTNTKKAKVPHRALLSIHLRKRIFDLCFTSFVLVVVLGWLLPLIALLIKLDSRGPIFFRQLRTGKNGQSFYCIKFRSMKVNDLADSKQAHRDDDRITRVGRFLRKTSLDELPQFLNVLRGDMSIVGPRPHMLQHTTYYSPLVHNYMDRHLVLPGITGLAQVSGHRGETKEVEAMAARVSADIHYIRHMSCLLDLRIILYTALQVLRPGNAF